MQPDENTYNTNLDIEISSLDIRELKKKQKKQYTTF